MGNWTITIKGVGAHHNRAHAFDANRMARRFIEEMIASSHQITEASFVYDDGKNTENLLDPAEKHPEDP